MSVPVQVDLWQLVSGLSAIAVVFGLVVFAFGKLLLSQVERRLDERFETQEKARSAAQVHWDERFNALDKVTRHNEREHLKLLAELPREYVRREDWIRFGVTIDAKLDGVHTKIDSLLREQLHAQRST